MNVPARTLIFAAILLVGCGATRDVAVTSYHVTRGVAVGSYRVTRGVAVGSYRVASAPIHYALRKRGEGSERVTTETISPDEAGASQAGPASQGAVTRRQPQVEMETIPSDSSASTRVSRRETTQSKPRPPPSSRVSSTQSDFPTAKAVPDKPGYVVSPFDSSGRYVDVTGYASGSKVKDPWTDKIFIVP